MTVSIQSNPNDGALLVNGTIAVPFNLGGVTSKIQSPNVTVVANALSCAFGPAALDFRSATANNGIATTQLIDSALTALAITNPALSSLGAVTAVQTRIIYGVALNAGSPQIIMANMSGGLQMDESNLITTTAMSGTVTSATTWYSNTAISTPTPYRLIGYVDATWTNGTGWAITGSVQGSGGNPISQTAVIGSSRNLKMSVTTASATATMTADEIILENVLGGYPYRLPNFSKTINLATTGAGGMDTGSAPVSGFVALYAIYNPTSGASALLATNATSAVAPEVYGGANMPAGYTASALVSVWPTNGSGQFIIGYQADRQLSTLAITVLNSTTPASSITSLSIASAVPKNAKTATLQLNINETNAGGGVQLNVQPDASNQIGIIAVSAFVSGQTSNSYARGELPLINQQTIFYQNTNTNLVTNVIFCLGYKF